MASLSLATLVASFFAIGVAQAETFPDVQPSDWFYSYVEDLVALGVVNGSMPEYRPGDNVNRAEMAKLVVEAFDIDLVSPDEATFNDVAAGTWYYEYVETAAAHGIVSGYKDDEGTLTGYYGPADAVTREQAAKMIVLGAPLELNTNCGPSFPDVGVNRWSYEYVETLYVNSVVDGYPDGTFGPEANINRAEIAKIVSNGMAPMLRPCGGFSVASADAMSATTAEVCFTQDYDETSAMMPENYVVEDGNGDELAVTDVEATSDPMCVLLTTDAQDSTKVYDLLVSDVMSAEGEELLSGEATFDGYTVGSVGDLTVRLDGSSPESADIPRNGANILFSVFAFEAGADEALNVEQVVVSRTGLGLPGDFENVKLYVDGVQMGGEKTVNSTTNTATFNLANDPIEVPAGSGVLVEVRGDLDAEENSQNAFCIGSPDDVTAYGADTGEEVSVAGDFAVCGDYMTTTSAEVGTLTYRVSTPSDADVNVGDADVIFTKLRLDADEEDIMLDRVTFKQMGSADAEDFGNPRLVLSGSPVDANYSWEGDYLTFDLTELDTPVIVDKGASKNFELWVDVVGGLGNDASFDIYRDWHIEGTGQVYHYGVNVEEDGGSITPNDRDIVGGNIAFSLSANNPIAGDVARGANDFEFLRFNVSTAGEAVTVRKLTLAVTCGAGGVATEIEDLKIWGRNASDELVVVAGPNDVTACGDIAFTDSFDVPGMDTTEYVVTADITNNANAGGDFDIDVQDVTDPSFTELEYAADGDPVDEANEVSGGTLDGNIMTVADPAVDVTLAATPGDKTYVKNTTDRDLVAFDFQASTADDLRITGLTVSCTAGGPGDCSDAFQSLNLYLKDGSTLTKLDGPESLSSAGADGEVVFSFSQDVMKGNSVRLLVRGNIASAAVADTYDFEVLAGDVTVEDSEGSDADVNLLPTAARTVTVAGAGAVTNQNVSDADVKSRILVGGNLDESVLKIRFSASELEAWYVRKLQLDEINSGNDADVSKVYLTYNDGVGTYTASANLIGSEVDFNLPTGHYIYVPADGSTTVTVSVDVGPVSTGGALAGDLPQFEFDGGSNFEAVGASSATVDNAADDVTGEVMRVARSAPTVVQDSIASTLGNGQKDLYKWTVAADDAGDVAVKQFAFEVDVTGAAGVDLEDFVLLENGADISSTSTTVDIIEDGVGSIEPGDATINGATTTYVLVQWRDGSDAGEKVIPAGSSVTYTLRATVSGYTGATDESVSTTLLNDTAGNAGVITDGADFVEVDGTASNFVWSDLSISPHDSELGAPSSTDWLDGYLVDGLSSITTVTLD